MKNKKRTVRDWYRLMDEIEKLCDRSGPARSCEHYTTKLRKIEEMVREAKGE